MGKGPIALLEQLLVGNMYARVRPRHASGLHLFRGELEHAPHSGYARRSLVDGADGDALPYAGPSAGCSGNRPCVGSGFCTEGFTPLTVQTWRDRHLRRSTEFGPNSRR